MERQCKARRSRGRETMISEGSKLLREKKRQSPACWDISALLSGEVAPTVGPIGVRRRWLFRNRRTDGFYCIFMAIG